MEIKMKRLKNIDKEDFCLVFFDGTRMPNNPEYIEITMFNDVFSNITPNLREKIINP